MGERVRMATAAEVAGSTIINIPAYNCGDDHVESLLHCSAHTLVDRLQLQRKSKRV